MKNLILKTTNNSIIITKNKEKWMAWLKQNLVSIIVFIFSLLSTLLAFTVGYTTVTNKVNALENEQNKREIYIDRLQAVEKEQILYSKNLEYINITIKEQSKLLSEISKNNSDLNVKTVVLNNSMETLNVTLNKMNSTLEKLNITVVKLDGEIDSVKDKVEDMENK